MRFARVTSFVALLLVLSACATPSTTAPAPQGNSQAANPAPATVPSRTLTIAVRYEVNDLGANTISRRPSPAVKRLFNAGLTLIDGKGVTQPYLADTVPQLNSGTWRVSADGRMETTYTLKPNLTWQDGKPLTSDDFVFGFKAFTTPGLAIFNGEPQDRLDDVTATDPHTVVFHWKRLYPDADKLNDNFPPLPRHIVEPMLNTVVADPTSAEAFYNDPFWTTQYISPGPFKIESWMQGSELNATAFEGHALGRPKIDKLVIKIVPDENTALSNILAENVTLATDFTLRYEHASVLKREWAATQKGTYQLYYATRHYSFVQFRPDLQKTPALLDLRVRKALAHSIDRQALNDALFNGEGFMTDNWIPPMYPYYPEVDKAVTHYPYDPRQTERYMNEAGLTKGSDGVYVSAAGDRFKPDFWVEQGSQFEKELVIIQDMWAKSGIDINPYVLPAAQVGDNQARASFPGMATPSITANERSLNYYTSAQIGSPANRWAGGNHGAWSNPEIDQLWVNFNTSLERPQRDQQIIQTMKIVSEQLPMFTWYFNTGVLAHLSTLKGPDAGIPETYWLYNVHTWEFK
jgi:peptide/nickel transport system substrate-binding protein